MSGMRVSEIDKIIGRNVSENVQRTDSRYESERNRLVADLSEKGILDAIAIHEAGHEHYYRNAGGYGFEFVPPVVLLRKSDSYPFKRQLARIAVGGYTHNKEDKDWFLKLAKGYAAGGVCSSSLSSSRRYLGDKADRKRWDEMCTDCHKSEEMTEEKLKEIADATWRAAQIEIRKEIENPTLKFAILKRAAEIKPLLFPWLPVDSHP